MVKIWAGVALATLVAMLGATWYLGRAPDDQFAGCYATQIGTGRAAIGGPLELISETGTAVTDVEMFAKPTLLYFGYTFCPDVCPLDNARNAEALDVIKAAGYDAQAAFVSVDPERDTPERLGEFTDYMHDDMTGYTGTPAQIKAASQTYKTYFRKEVDGDPEYYLIDHTTLTYLVLPEHGFVEFFKRDDTPEDLAARVGCFIDASS